MNLYQKSSFSSDTRIISPLGNDKYVVMELLYINNYTNFHCCNFTDEIISLTPEEFSEFKEIKLKKDTTYDLKIPYFLK